MNLKFYARGAFKVFLCIGFDLGNVEWKLLGKYYIKTDYLRFRKLVLPSRWQTRKLQALLPSQRH